MTQLLRKRLAAGVFVLAGALALAACGGGATGTPTPFSLGGGSRIQGFTPTPTAETKAVTPEASTTTPTGPAPTNGPPPSLPPPPPNGLRIGSVGNELLFDTDKMTASAGSQVAVAFKNNATTTALQHNWVLVAAGTEDTMAAAGLAAGPSSDWIPKDDPNVLAFVPLIDGGASGDVTFPAPPPGTYAFVCTFPGHSGTMNGEFEVTG